LEYLRMKVRPPSRYAFLACVAYARREQDAGRGFRLDPLLGDIAGRLPDDIIREFVLPFLLGTLETEAGALVLREMGESHFAAGEYDDALDYYRRSLDVSLHISYANALSDARTVLVERMEAVSVALPGGAGENARSVVADAKWRVQRWVEEEEARAHTLYLQYQEKKRRREEKRKEDAR
jgi:tetratricopeptide (TPR) repeat protein